MKVAIMSDSHDHIENTKWAIEICQQKKVERIFHCGDLISPFMILTLAKFEGPIDLIWGNNRGDIYLICELLKNYPQITLHGDFAFLEIKGFKIAMVHYPQLAEKLSKSFNYVFCGHTHKFKIWEVDFSLIINPGEIMGKEGSPSFVILDLEKRVWERVIKE